MTNTIKPFCAATLLLLSGAAAQAANNSFSNIYLFGDSLTDSGAFAGQLIPNGSGGFVSLPTGARWTIDNASNHADVLAGKLGLAVTAANAASTLGSSGNNFAQGGAQSLTYATGASLPGGATQTAGPGGLDIRDLPQQIQDYLAAHGNKADPSALYFVWSGGNDIPTAAAAGSTSAALSTAQAAAQSQGQQIAALHQAGARLIIAPNLPSFGNTPAAFFAIIDGNTALDSAQKNALKAATATALRSGNTVDAASQQARIDAALSTLASGLSGGATSGAVYDNIRSQLVTSFNSAKKSLNDLTAAYNLSTDAAISASGANVLRANVNALFAEALANPAAFGISNVTGPACGANASTGLTSSLICTSAMVSGSETYLFADDRHPSPVTHRLLGNYFASLLQGPAFAQSLTTTPLFAIQQANNTLDAHYRLLDTQPRATGSINVYSTVASGKQDTNTQDRQQGELITIGMDTQLNPLWTAGLAFTKGKTNTRLGALGSYDSSHTQLGSYGNYRNGQQWLDIDFSLGVADIDTKRHVDLGTVQRTEQGNTRSNHFAARAQGGIRLTSGKLTTGPVIGLSLVDGKIGTLIESSQSSTAMRFAKQELKEQQVSLGWQVAATRVGRWSPYASVQLVREMHDQANVIKVGLVSTSGDFSVAGKTPDRQWMNWQLGSNVSLDKAMDGFIRLNGSQGRQQQDSLQISAGINARF